MDGIWREEKRVGVILSTSRFIGDNGQWMTASRSAILGGVGQEDILFHKILINQDGMILSVDLVYIKEEKRSAMQGVIQFLQRHTRCASDAYLAAKELFRESEEELDRMMTESAVAIITGSENPNPPESDGTLRPIQNARAALHKRRSGPSCP